MTKLNRDELLKRLERLDEDASLTFPDGQRFRMTIVGGSALILLETIARATLDIDALSVPPEIVPLLERFDINCQVQAYINSFPYNFEDRLILIKSGRTIDFFTASLEDIVISKLCSHREKDRLDIENPQLLGQIDWELLNILATDELEARASAMNERNYSDLLSSYNEYVRRFCPCGN